MIRSIQKLGCTPGGSCCASCASHHLGDVTDAGSPHGLLWVFAVILGGFALAYGASGKARMK